MSWLQRFLCWSNLEHYPVYKLNFMNKRCLSCGARWAHHVWSRPTTESLRDKEST